jgi:prepilin-type N-terminal cleavage/methylation domain-containing protein
MAVVLLAGLGKLIDLPAFESDLRTWQLLPSGWNRILALDVPAMECLVAGAWFLALGRRLPVVATGVMLVAFLIGYGVHLLFAEPPRCGCFGALLRFERQEHGAELAVGKNLFMLAMLLTGTRLVPGNLADQHPRTRAARERIAASGAAHSTGFTLVEMILSITLIAILSALVIPSLSGVRRAARRVADHADLRTHATIMSAYTNDYRDVFPFTTDPDATYTVRRHPTGYTIEIVYFGGSNSWHWPLLDGYYAEDLRGSTFAANGDDDDYPFTSYWYAASFLARPEFWNEETRTGPNQWRSNAQGDVAFPSAKGILFNQLSMFPDPDEAIDNLRRVDVAFVDGSVRAVAWDALSPPYFRGEGNWQGSWFGSGLRVMHTIDGTRGRDVR